MVLQQNLKEVKERAVQMPGREEISVEEREGERVSPGLLPDVVRDQVSFQSPAGSLQFSCHGSQLEEEIMH